MKITQKQQVELKELYDRLVQRAWESVSFKEQLINNPKVAISEVVGRPVFEQGFKVVVCDQTDDSKIYLNIPQKVNLDNIELSDEQLESIAGGEIAASAGLALACIALFGAGVSIGLAIPK